MRNRLGALAFLALCTLTTSAQINVVGQVPASSITGTLNVSSIPTGTTSGTVAAGNDSRFLNATSLNGTSITTLTGILKLTSGTPSNAAAADVIALWSGTCSSTTVLLGNGACGPAVLTAPTASVLGGVFSSSAPTNQFATGVNTSGALTYAQPAFSNLSGTIATGQLPASVPLLTQANTLTNVAAPATPAPGFLALWSDSTNKVLSAKNDAGTLSVMVMPNAGTSHQFITALSNSGVLALAQPAFSDVSGTVAASQLPNPSATSLGGIQSAAPTGHQWINSISTSGVPALSQPSFADISGTASAAQLPNPSASTLGGVQSYAAVSHQFLTSISTAGIPASAQPAAADITGLAASATTDTTNAANITSGTLNNARLSAIPNSALANSSLTVTPGSSMSGGGAISLGASATINRAEPVNAQVGTTYTIVAGDLGKLTTFTNSGAVSVTLPQATGSFAAGWFEDLSNLGAGTVTITPVTSTINGAASLAVPTGQFVRVVSDGTNYQVASLSIANSTAPSNQFATGVNTAHGLTYAQPAFSNLSGTLSTSQLGGTVSGDLSGTLPSPTVAKVNGTSFPTNSAADQTPVTTASATGSWTSIPACLDSGGNHLNYNTSTHAFSCGTSGGPAVSAAFNTIQSGTNTSAAMVVGTGASLTTSGSGTVTATSLIDANQNNVLTSTATASAVDSLNITNAAATGTPVLGAVGSDMNIPLTVKGKGTGQLNLNSTSAHVDNAGALTVVSCTGCSVSSTAPSNQFATAISSAGALTYAQPAFSNLSGTAAASQLPNPSATTIGGVESYAAVSHQWINTISTSGVPSSSQPAFADISGSVAASQLPNPSATTLGGVESIAATSHQFLTSISTLGVPAAAQPAAADVSGLAASATTDTTNAANITSGTLPNARLVSVPNSALANSSVTVSPGLGLSGGGAIALGGSATLNLSETLNAQTGTTYTVVNGDGGKLLTFNNAAAVAVTLPQAGASSQFLSGWVGDVSNIGAGAVTITPTTSTIQGAATLVLQKNQSVRIISDGTNYQTTALTVSPSTAGSNQFATGISNAGTLTFAQPAFSNISGTVGAGQLPTPTASTLGGVESLAAVSHQFLTSISTAGVPAQAQPAFTDISGTIATGQLPASVPLSTANDTNVTATIASNVLTMGWQGTLANARLTNSSLTVSPGAGLSGGGSIALGGSATLTRSESVNAQTGTTYTIVAGDQAKLVTFSNAAAVAVTLPQATGSFASGWFADIQNLGAGIVTITPTTSTINAAATYSLATNQGLRVVSDGTNYQVRASLGIQPFSQVSHQWINSIAASGAASASQPAFSDISGSVAASQLPNPSASTLGGIESYTAVAHQWINSISTAGVPSSTQPNYTDLAGNLSGDTTTVNGSSVTTTVKVNGVSYGTSPGTNTVAVVTGTNATTYEAVPNAALANSSLTVTAGAGLAGGGAISLGGSATLWTISTVNAQTGTTYTVVNGDQAKLLTFNNAAAVAVTLPQAGASGNFASGWFADIQDLGAGTVTITPTISTIDGAASLALPTTEGIRLFSDGTNYFTQRGLCLTCDTSASTLASGQLLAGAGSRGIQTTNLSGDVTTSGSAATTVASTHITGASTNALPRFSSGNLVNSALTDDATKVSTSEPLNVTTQPVEVELGNASAGTSTGSLVKQIDTSGTLQITKTATTDTGNAIGCVQSNAGTSGTAQVAVLGTASCLFDNVPVTDGDSVIVSTNTAGVLSDAGPQPAAGVLNLGIAKGTHAACGAAPCGPYTVLLVNPNQVGIGSVTTPQFDNSVVSSSVDASGNPNFLGTAANTVLPINGGTTALVMYIAGIKQVLNSNVTLTLPTTTSVQQWILAKQDVTNANMVAADFVGMNTAPYYGYAVPTCPSPTPALSATNPAFWFNLAAGVSELCTANAGSYSVSPAIVLGVVDVNATPAVDFVLAEPFRLSPFRRVELFGTGSDGTVAVTSGTTTVDTLKSYESFTVTGGTVNHTSSNTGTLGVVVYSQNPVMIIGSGSVSAVGKGRANSAAGTGAGAAGSVGGLSGTGGGGGGSGTTSAAGGAGGSHNGWVTFDTGFPGGAGGAATPTAGTAGTAALSPIYRVTTYLPQCTGTSGGNGAGDGTNAGGTGGTAGGSIYIQAPAIYVGSSASVQADGAAGGNGAGGNAAGGGGGGGGCAILNAGYINVVGTLSAAGGAAGAKGGTGSGTAGAVGGAGITQTNRLW